MGTKVIYFRISLRDDAVGSDFYMRTKGMTNSIAIYKATTQVVDTNYYKNWKIPCDSNYKVEYVVENLTWSLIEVTVTAWEGYISTTETDVEDDLAALEARVTVNEGDITVAEAAIGVAEGDIVTLEGEMDDAEDRLTVNEGNIAALSVQASRVLNVYNEAATPDEWRVINGRWVRV